MIFKKLELQGFKTFFDRTEVHFRPGINAVVGPNGCGKSNIADAIRWVLGEQSSKQLRGEKMEDMIFSGSESRHALGMAEVALTVESSGEEFPAPYNRFTEVCVTRRLYRSGESEFFINNTPCRLRDIRELFLDTGMNPKAYAVISQGSIGDIIKARPEDRRVFLEEAAGIAKFKERKGAALRKLEATEQNLVRIADLTAEYKRQLGSIQRQARKAERFHELRLQQEDAELRVLAHQHAALLERVRAHGERIAGYEELEGTLRNEAAALEAGLEAGALEALETEKAVAALREESYAHRAVLEALDRELEVARARAAALAQTIARGDAEDARLAALVEGAARDLGRIGEELAQLEGRLAATETEAAEAATRLEAASAAARALREAREGLVGRQREGARVEGESQRRLTQLETRAESVDRDLERIGAELAAIEEEDAVLAAREGDLAARLAAGRSEHEGNAEAHAAATVARSLAADEAARVDAELAAGREELAAATTRLASLAELERNLAGWPELLREQLERVIAHDDLTGGVRGLLADALHVPAEHEAALEAVLGERLKCLLVASPGVGVEAARVLQEGAAVRGTFLPVAPRRAPDADPGPAAGLPRLIDVVTVAPALRAAAEHLLQDVRLAESLPAAAALWEAGAAATFVTPAGEVLWADGSITAGRLDPSRELLPLVRSIRETQAAAAGLEERVAALGAAQEGARTRLRAAEEQVRLLAEEGRRIELAIGALEKDLLLARQKRSAHAAQRERLSGLRDRAAAERASLDAGIAEERERRSGLAAERSRHEEELAAADAALAERLREERALMERQGALKVELAGGRERAAHLATRRDHLAGESVRAGARREEVARETAEARAGIAGADEAVAGLAARRAVLLEERARIEARLGEAQDRHRDLSGRSRETEERLRGLRARREELQTELAALRVALAEEEVRRQHLRTRLAEVRDVPPEELWDEAVRAEVVATPLATLEERLRGIAAQIQALGPVNLAALGDQQEIQERLEVNRRQQADLEQAVRDLRQAILKINATSREKFLETFERVNEAFQETFPQLLENGHALLRLTESEDPLDAGVEILAQPAGKKLKHISLLSGGEQALTAIALLLAIFMVKPSPFCLLDEVDAPLDESNVARFLRALRRAVGSAQLVMITHNKRTMESANHLVGVTMSDPGVSRLISVRLRAEADEPRPRDAEEAVGSGRGAE